MKNCKACNYKVGSIGSGHCYMFPDSKDSLAGYCGRDNATHVATANPSAVLELTTRLRAAEQKIAEQAAVIERLLSSIKALQGNSCGDYADEICAEALAIPTDSKKILADWLDSVLREPSAYQSKRDPNFVTTLTNTAKQWESSGFGIDPLFKKPEIN